MEINIIFFILIIVIESLIIYWIGYLEGHHNGLIKGMRCSIYPKVVIPTKQVRR